VGLQNAPWGSRPEHGQDERAGDSGSLLPLIRGEVEFKRLILREPDLLIETTLRGRSNLEFKTGGETGKGEKKTEGPAALPPLIFEEVRVENGILTYRDGKTGKTLALKLELLTAALPGGEKPIDLQLKGSFNGQAFEVEGTTGPLKALLSPEKPWPLKLTARLGGATVGAEGTLSKPMRGKGLNLAIRAEGPSCGRRPSSEVERRSRRGGLPGEGQGERPGGEDRRFGP